MMPGLADSAGDVGLGAEGTIPGMTSTPGPGRRTFPLALPPWPQLRRAIADGVVVGLSCLLTYWLATTILAAGRGKRGTTTLDP
jgi:hypothetical protein